MRGPLATWCMLLLHLLVWYLKLTMEAFTDIHAVPVESHIATTQPLRISLCPVAARAGRVLLPGLLPDPPGLPPYYRDRRSHATRKWGSWCRRYVPTWPRVCKTRSSTSTVAQLKYWRPAWALKRSRVRLASSMTSHRPGLMRGGFMTCARTCHVAGLGVASVCDLVSASAGDLPTAALLAGQPVRRIAFAITTLLHQAEPLLLHACGAARQAAQFTILSAVSEAAHHDEQPSAYSPSCFAEAAARMQQHLNTARLSDGVGPCSVAVLHFPPLLLCPVLPSAFVFPATSAAALRPRMGAWPAGWATAPPQGLDSDSEGEDAAHPAPASAAGVLGAGCGGTAGLSSASSGEGLALLAHTLVQLAAVLGLRLEAFSCGPTSTQVAKHMAFVPPATSPSGEQPEETAALVLVDRACDLLTPALHPDLLLARMVDALPFAMAVAEAAAAAASGEREAGSSAAEAADSGGQSTPAAADKGSGVGSSLPLLAVPTAAHWQPQGSASAAAAEGLGSAVGGSGDGSLSSTLLPGSLCAPRDPQLQQWLAFLLGRCGKDAPLFLRKWLREALRKVRWWWWCCCCCFVGCADFGGRACSISCLGRAMRLL